jgi:hypothetical protein
MRTDPGESTDDAPAARPPLDVLDPGRLLADRPWARRGLEWYARDGCRLKGTRVLIHPEGPALVVPFGPCVVIVEEIAWPSDGNSEAMRTVLLKCHLEASAAIIWGQARAAGLAVETE